MSQDSYPYDPYDVITLDDTAALTTRLIHDGDSSRSSAFPVYQSTTVDGVYIRMRNPTVAALEEKMRAVEGGACTLAMSSGMAAISHTLFGLLRPGERLVVHRTLFVGARTLLSEYVERMGIEVVRIDLNDTERLTRTLTTAPRAVYFETISNAALEVVDAPRVIAAAKAAGALAIVDNTLLTPCLFRPLAYGADVVIHSATKYLGGHADVLAGIATFSDPELGQRIHTARRLFGGLLSPAAAALVMRGLKTLTLRMEQHCRNALVVARYLDGHPGVRHVRYPALETSEHHVRASSFLPHTGAIVTFELAAQPWEVFAGRLKLCRVGMSFGDGCTRVQREGAIRLSVGLEDSADIVRDLAAAVG